MDDSLRTGSDGGQACCEHVLWAMMSSLAASVDGGGTEALGGGTEILGGGTEALRLSLAFLSQRLIRCLGHRYCSYRSCFSLPQQVLTAAQGQAQGSSIFSSSAFYPVLF